MITNVLELVPYC